MTGLTATAIAALGAAWAIRYGRRHGLIDVPDERRSHQGAIPRGGGIGVLVACLACMLALALNAPDRPRWWLLGSGLLLVGGIGWRDDHRAMRAWPRLGVHALAATLLAAALYLEGASMLACLAGFVLALGLVNAWNFMDGIDGLAASQALLCALALATIRSPEISMLAIVLAGACLGFLPFNAPRARVFLGDVGSGGLGYVVACLLAMEIGSSPVRQWPWLLFPVVAMLADSGLTLLWRWRRGDAWWQPHREHAYQRWSRAIGHAPVAAAYALWTTAMIGVMLWTRKRPAIEIDVLFLACMAAAMGAWWWLHRRYARQTEGFGP